MTAQDTQIKLSARGMSVGCLHGELDKAQRQNVLARFKRGEHRALLVSDVAARGLDVPDCDAVVNLELPSGPDHYAHRAGRTGRAGRYGQTLSCMTRCEATWAEKVMHEEGTRTPVFSW